MSPFCYMYFIFVYLIINYFYLIFLAYRKIRKVLTGVLAQVLALTLVYLVFNPS